MQYAIVDSDQQTVLRTQDVGDGVDINTENRTKPYALPLEEDKPALAQGEEYTTKIYEVQQTKVIRHWAKRVTPIPTAADRIDAAFPETDVATVMFKVFLDHENRIRVLEGRASITAAQLKTALQGMLT